MPKAAANIHSVDAGQHQIEDQQIIGLFQRQLKAFFSVLNADHLTGEIGQMNSEQLNYPAIVFDYKDLFHFFGMF
jgi:hypothetical protein